MKYVFHPQALTEYSQAVQYYAESRLELAQGFIDAVEDTVYQIRESPTRCPLIDEDTLVMPDTKVSLRCYLYNRARLHSNSCCYALQSRVWILEKS
ncbi:hypothetical protein [Nostoc sp.]|uniref:hypothetical protein n=1 Tax=Nostoc sp. TaxID=1180 RepID=UPI002FF690FA